MLPQILPWAFMALGLAFLVVGAHGLIRGGSGIALRFGLSPLVVGLTVVAFGTSSPELVVSVRASLLGDGSISVGNVVGSNICNLALILGLCALVHPLRSDDAIIRRELPILVGATAAGAAILIDGTVSRGEGLALFAALVVYTALTVRSAKSPSPQIVEEFDSALPKPPPALWASALLSLGGLGLLAWGSELFVKGASQIAASFGVSEVVIGLTIVSVGTSLPEIATSLVAVLRKEIDFAVGNVVGSNLFNLLGVMGISAAIKPMSAPDLQYLDVLVMLAVAIAVYPFARTQLRICRREGAVLLLGYVSYVAWAAMR